jgi:UDP:flavonoid glycosyltransferase YjiC (YdhE family)
MLDRMLRRFNAPLHAALADAGMPSPDLRLFRGRSTLLHLVACSPSIVEVPADLPPSSRVTGAWLDPRPPAALPAEVERFLHAGEAPLLVTFGSMASDAAVAHAAIVSDALTTARRRAIVQGLPVQASEAILPAGALDHRALMPRTRAVMHHGGAGTTHAVVAAAIPSIVVPHVGDQRYWGDRLHRLGVAPAPIAPHDLSSDRLLERITAVDERDMRARAADLARQVSAEAGVATAVAAIHASVSSPG